jgi:Carboxypeptidase regulatory-like domain
MRVAGEILAALSLTALTSATALGASIVGTVTGPDGKPFMGPFVAAENPQSRMTVNVLSGAHGRYHIDNLPAATYTVSISAIGYASEPRGSLALAADMAASLDFALAKTPVRWSDLSTYQGRQLLPKTTSHDLSYKDQFFTTCFQSCHSFQKRMATQSLDLDGWRARVRYMSDTMLEGRHLNDTTVEDFASYLDTMFGKASAKPGSPEDLPQYKSLVRPVNAAATNIVYVEYDFAADDGMGPWSAVEDKDGKFWIPYYGRGNKVVRLDPKTGEQTPFPLPFSEHAAAGIHSVIPAADGTVWFTELAAGRIGQLDPSTGKVTEHQNPPLPNGRRTTAHTVRVDEAGRVWASGGPAISMFDPKYERFVHRLHQHGVVESVRKPAG